MHIIYNPYWNSSLWSIPWHSYGVFLPAAVWGRNKWDTFMLR